MTRSQSLGFKLRWLILLASLACWVMAFFWLTLPLCGDDRSDAVPSAWGWGIWGLMGWQFDHAPAYRMVAAALAGAFLMTQWLFLWPRGAWRVELAEVSRPLKRSIVMAASAAALLSMGAIALFWESIGFWDAFAGIRGPHADSGIWGKVWPGLAAIGVLWAFWTIVFLAYWHQGDRYTQLGRMIRGLLAASIIETIVAVPVHAWAIKERKLMDSSASDCQCALGSYTALVFAGTVAIWTFGPGLTLLFMRERYRREKLLTGSTMPCRHCHYDLNSTIQAGQTHCPECGQPVRPEDLDVASAQRPTIGVHSPPTHRIEPSTSAMR